MNFTSGEELDALADKAADDAPAVIREETTRKQDQKEQQIDEGHHFLCVSNVSERASENSRKLTALKE